MRYFKFTPFFLLLLSACVSYKKQYDRIDSAEIREALTVKDSSYFIYRDSISGEDDSFWVKDYRNSFWEYDDLHYKENIYYSLYDTSGRRSFFSATGTEFQGIEWVSGHLSLDSTWWDFVPFSSPVRSDERLEMFFIQYFDTYTVRGRIYNRVYNYKNADTAQNQATSYYSLESGLVKLDIRNADTHKVYELVRSKIIK